jgi:hypothetical protein
MKITMKVKAMEIGRVAIKSQEDEGCSPLQRRTYW